MKYYKIIVLILLFNLTGCSQEQLFDPGSSINIAVGSAASKVAIADLNDDSFNDLIVTTNDGLVVLLNDGKGNFKQPEGSPFPAGNEPADIGLADFNKDGNLDLAIPNHERDEITILFGNGTGKFKEAIYTSLKIDLNPHAHSVAAADLNNDGNIDLALTNFLGAEIILEFGDGKGNFSANPVHISVPHYPYRNVIISDINLDGKPDIITPANNMNSITILLGDGKGNFSSAKGSPFGIGNYPFFTTVGDFNADGYPDLLATNFNSGEVSVLPGNKVIDFSSSKLKTFNAGLKPVCVATGDLNSDGITDAVCANYESNDITILLGNKETIFNAKIKNIPVGTSPYGVAVGDLNGDNKPDIVTANFESNNITVLFNLNSN